MPFYGLYIPPKGTATSSAAAAAGNNNPNGSSNEGAAINGEISSGEHCKL